MDPLPQICRFLVRKRQNMAHQDVDTLVVAYLTAEANIATHHWTLHAASQPILIVLCWGLTTRQLLRVILCRLPEKGRKEIEERVEEMKERDREERGTGMKVKKQKK